MEAITTRLRHIIAEQLDVDIPLESVTEDISLMESGLGLDSIAIVELITLVEETFNIQLGEDDLNMEAFSTIQTLAGLIETKLQTANTTIQA